MLEKLREGSKGWLAAVLILMLVGSFGMFGVSDMLNLVEAPKIASVGGEDIPPEQFQQEFTRFLGQMARSTGQEITSQQAKNAGLDRVALERFVKKLSVLKVASDLGLTISDDQIVESLKAIPGLVDDKGKLRPGAISQLARVNNLNEQQFLELVIADLIREQLLRTVAGGVGLPKGLENALNLYRLERRVTDYVIIDESRAGEIPTPTDEQISKFYNENAMMRYSTPEFRDVAFVVARPEDVEATITITDEEIAKVYGLNKKIYETPEKRVLEQIRFKTEAAATAAKAKLDAGTKFEAIAKAEGLTDADFKLGEVAKGDVSVPAVAFELPALQISAPVKNSFGTWVIIRTMSVTPGSVRTLDEVKEEIRKKILEPKVKDHLFELTNNLEDELGKGATLEEAAGKLKLQVHKATMTLQGEDASGNPVPALPGGQFLEQVFAADTATEPELLQTDEGTYYEFRVDKITKTAKKPLDGIKEQVASDWKDHELSLKLDAIAKDVLKRGKAGESFQTIAQSLGVSVLSSDPVPRFGKTAVFSELTVSAASNAKKNEFFTGPVTLGKGLVVGRVTDIIFETEPLESPNRSMYTQRVLQSFVSDFVEQFENGARVRANASIDEPRFQAFHSNE